MCQIWSRSDGKATYHLQELLCGKHWKDLTKTVVYKVAASELGDATGVTYAT